MSGAVEAADVDGTEANPGVPLMRVRTLADSCPKLCCHRWRTDPIHARSDRRRWCPVCASWGTLTDVAPPALFNSSNEFGRLAWVGLKLSVDLSHSPALVAASSDNSPPFAVRVPSLLELDKLESGSKAGSNASPSPGLLKSTNLAATSSATAHASVAWHETVAGMGHALPMPEFHAPFADRRFLLLSLQLLLLELQAGTKLHGVTLGKDCRRSARRRRQRSAGHTLHQWFNHWRAA